MQMWFKEELIVHPNVGSDIQEDVMAVVCQFWSDVGRLIKLSIIGHFLTLAALSLGTEESAEKLGDEQQENADDWDHPLTRRNHQHLERLEVSCASHC